MKPKKSRKPKPTAPIAFDERLRFTINEGSALLKQSRAKTYMDIVAGTLGTIKDGKRRYIPGSEILRRSALPGG